MSHAIHALHTLNAPDTPLRAVPGLPYSRPATPSVHDSLRLGWVGLGAMGTPMATNLVRSPPARPPVALPLRVWNRSRDKALALQRELGEPNIAIADSPEDVAQNCDVIFTMLASDEVVKDVYARFAAALKVRTAIVQRRRRLNRVVARRPTRRPRARSSSR
jgi:hypothetical protein